MKSVLAYTKKSLKMLLIKYVWFDVFEIRLSQNDIEVLPFFKRKCCNHLLRQQGPMFFADQADHCNICEWKVFYDFDDFVKIKNSTSTQHQFHSSYKTPGFIRRLIVLLLNKSASGLHMKFIWFLQIKQAMIFHFIESQVS